MIQEMTSHEGIECIADVKIGKKDIVVPKGSSMKINCISHCGPVFADTPVIFQPDMNLELQSDLIIGEGVMSVKRGRTSRFLIPVSNLSSSNIPLRAKTKLGDILSISSVIPCPMEDLDHTTNNEVEDQCAELSIVESEVSEEWLSKMDLSHLNASR